MIFYSQQAIKAFILLMFSGFIFMLHHTGEIDRFINPQYTSLSQVASIIFLFLFFIQVPRIFLTKEQAEDHDYCSILGCNHETDDVKHIKGKSIITYSIIFLPLFTGFLLPYKELGAAEAVKRGICYSHNEGETFHLEERSEIELSHVIKEMKQSRVLTVDKKNFVSYVNSILTYPDLFYGKEIELEGFISVDKSASEDHLLIARFLVTHCVADAHVMGLLLSVEDERLQNENDWIRMKGVLDINEQSTPIVEVREWEKVEQPKNPYIYP
ncbi:TIGR03943 family protein [Bacillus shivajii]|uniref:TIGR03943 family putative permease subunit n=1 Tax=Bacillus shivajii TaxID=1983719 RepID=UPI001CF9D26E|nr:TIGR03943 family protein [Bacillus shivajii]UCZ54210.1 TIGR03943 family protein [Bacillus shivajii]